MALDGSKSGVMSGSGAFNSATQASFSYPPIELTTFQFFAEEILEILEDPAAFQFKAYENERGQTGALSNTTVWDNFCVNDMLFWEASDGTVYVVNGHQRLGLAKDIIRAAQEAGAPLVDRNGHPIMVKGWKTRAADGWTQQLAMRRGAEQNIIENSESTDPIDVAKFLKSGGQLEDLRGLTSSARNGTLRAAEGLLKLDDEIFLRYIIQGSLPPKWGAMIGHQTANPEYQRELLAIIQKRAPKSTEKVKALLIHAERIGYMGDSARRQINLFGDEEVGDVETKIEARERVYNRIVEELGRNTKALKTITNSADLKHFFDAHGLCMPDSTPEYRRQLSDLRYIVEKLWDKRGRLSDLINEAVDVYLARGGKDRKGSAKQAVDFFVTKARDIMGELISEVRPHDKKGRFEQGETLLDHAEREEEGPKLI